MKAVASAHGEASVGDITTLLANTQLESTKLERNVQVTSEQQLAQQHERSSVLEAFDNRITSAPIETFNRWRNAPAKRKLWINDVWHACRSGDYLEVFTYLKFSTERIHLIHGRDVNGDTALILAAMALDTSGDSSRIINDLLNGGADIDAKNLRGRTALMEAALWGRKKNIDALMKRRWKVQVDTGMKDEDGSQAVDLASTEKKWEEERKRRYLDNRYLVSTRFDEHFRAEIARNLRAKETAVCTPEVGKDVETDFAGSGSIVKHMGMNGHQPAVLGVRTELHESREQLQEIRGREENNRIRIRDLDEQLKKKQAVLDKMERDVEETQSKLNVTETRLRECEHKLVCIAQAPKEYRNYQEKVLQEELQAANAGIEWLEEMSPENGAMGQVEGNADVIPRIRFETINHQSSPYKTDIHCIRTFTIGPDPYTGGWRRCTLACIEISGRTYFAKNGKHNDTQDGLIRGAYWMEQASSLFKQLGSKRGQTWFMHVEPQLMALYVMQFLGKERICLKDFCDEKGVSSPSPSPRMVDIFVSRDICGTCVELVELMNKATRTYGFEFRAQYVSKVT